MILQEDFDSTSNTLDKNIQQKTEWDNYWRI